MTDYAQDDIPVGHLTFSHTSYVSQAPQAVLVEKKLSCGEVSPREKCEENLSHRESSPHDKCGAKSVVWRNVDQICYVEIFLHFSTQAIYAVLSRNLFCCHLRAFVWRKIKPKLLPVEREKQ